MRRMYEFSLVVALVAVLVLVLMNRLATLQGEMEEAGMQAEVAALRHQLMERVAHREAFGGKLPDSDNPMDWVGQVPPNYRGSLAGAGEEKAVWYFDSREKLLIYRFQDGHFARFKLSRQAGATGSRGVISGVGLMRLEDRP